MADKQWKKVERKIAQLWGGRREPVPGRQRGETPDVRHHKFSLEIKSRETALPLWLSDAIDQAVESMKHPGHWPIVRIHVNGTAYENDLVVTTAKYFDQHVES